MKENRIVYIDALRGFAILLVVLGHVPMYSYHSTEEISFGLIPSTFHLALFFFVSGWFFKRKASFATKWHIVSTYCGDAATISKGYDTEIGPYYTRNRKRSNNVNCWKVLKGKFVQLVVPTVVFYLLFCWMNEIDIMENLWSDKYKAGYWFCIVLFEFYLTLAITKNWKYWKTDGVGRVLRVGGYNAKYECCDRFAG